MAQTLPSAGSKSLPVVGSDNNAWGDKLNGFLSVAHTSDGYLSFVSTQTGSYTIGTNTATTPNTIGGETVLVDCTSVGSGNSVTITLPTAVGTKNIHTIKKIDSTASTSVIINTTSPQTIDNGTTATISVQYAAITVVSNGSNWYVI